MKHLLALLLLFAAFAHAEAPVYVLLWFDTEDYVEPAADDAALRLATDLSNHGVRATFKIVGEKARVLESRGRKDVIAALKRHDIGYHSNFHSGQPTPALYLRDLGWLEGAEQFEHRERPGIDDVRRILGVTPSCYGQPGSSWGPQSTRALLRMGVPVYLDEGENVGIGGQPFWFGGMLHVFGMKQFLIRPDIDDESKFGEMQSKFDAAVAEARKRGGGLISSYYHPTEFVTTEFWDAVNFRNGANPERSEWKKPHRRTPEASERAYKILVRYVEYAKSKGVRFVTARDLPSLYQPAKPAGADRAAVARHMAERQTFLLTGSGSLSAADMLQVLLGLDPVAVEGPATRIESTYRQAAIPRAAFERAKAETAGYLKSLGRIPSEIWIGSATLSPGDFAATLAGDDGKTASVRVRKANLEMERYVSSDPVRAFSWPIHPENFSAPQLLELARLQAWTLKPAIVRSGPSAGR